MNDYQSVHAEIDLLEKLYPYIIPKYHEAHDILVSMLDFAQTQDIRLADLGCGFGHLTKRIIDTFPSSVVFGIDKQPFILQRAQERLQDRLDQVVFYERNLNNTAWQKDIDHVHAIVSSFTLDYLPRERHQQILDEAYAIIEPGGRWVSCEFFRSEDNRVNRIFHDMEMAFIRSALERGEVTREQIDQLGKSSILRQDHFVVTVAQKMAWLKNSGFKTLEVPWRFLNLAIISAVR
ncbi:methyltransferase domain-containing protein [candidate division KSB1 bacterium]|nr:class I SAM-dependent methyltransferase [candidate division KSB1 bacterium]RQW00110.1 MAG: methyltransferase domain-containing protein [candidate division KSB1 bacterium]